MLELENERDRVEAEFQSMLAILGLEEQCIPALGHLLPLRYQLPKSGVSKQVGSV